MRRTNRNGVTKTELLVTLVGGGLALFFLACMGAGFVVEAPIRVLFGWIFFTGRNFANIAVSWTGVATFTILFIATWGLAHFLGSSFLTSGNRKLTSRVSFAATVFVVALFAAGIGATGVAHQAGWMIRSKQPFLASSGQAARRMSDSNKQKQVALGLHNHHSQFEDSGDPIGRLTAKDENGGLLHGWLTAVLPFMDQQSLYESIDRSHPWNSPRNSEPMGTVVQDYIRVDPSPETTTLKNGSYALSHLAANRLLMGDTKTKKFSDIEDGASQTVLFGSAAGEFLPWGHPQNWRGSDHVPNEDPRGFGSGFYGGCHIAMADGSVIFVTESIDPELWQSLFTPNGGETIDEMLNQ